jgi:hypothetical protein
VVKVVDYSYKGFQFTILGKEGDYEGYACVYFFVKNPSFRCRGKTKVELKRKFRLYVKSLPEEVFERMALIKPGQEIARN